MVSVPVTCQRASTAPSSRARGWNHNWAQKLQWRKRKIVGRMREATCSFIHANRVHEHPLTKRFSDDMIAEAIVNPAIGGDTIYKGFPCNTQATERIVKVVTEAAAAVCVPSRRDRFIRNRLKSRNRIPVFNTKHDYRSL
ncbi:hypothetical protein AVEN_168398-1 [Araneus ventricosus]|uniref:Uncharacterized protein n=1 Tax=Araneus ventricosus TaxID=182803 RepID=A0A4Y2GPZ7_ARAVE|nr:hypothetical protein AVEN_168398-1 [Araneus ventricosus]